MELLVYNDNKNTNTYLNQWRGHSSTVAPEDRIIFSRAMVEDISLATWEIWKV